MVAFAVLVYAVAFVGAAMLVNPLGMVGGFILGFVAAACLSGYLFLLSQAVRGAPFRWADLKQGFGALFWDVVSVLFAFWVISLASGLVIKSAGNQGPPLAAVIGLAMAFFLNPVPEMLYLGRSRSFELLLESARFVLANPVAWFLPNLLFAAAALGPLGALRVGHPGELLLLLSEVFSPSGLMGLVARLPLWALPIALIVVHYVMIFRGLLFQELTSGGARRRAWQSRVR